MKAMFCPLCHDVVGLIPAEWRQCYCKRSGGQYNKDGMTATLGGYARVLGLANPFFNELWPILTEEQRQTVRAANHYGPGDCWWGEFPGDTQIVRVQAAEGPRIAMRVKPSIGSNRITIIDKRPYPIDKKDRVKEIIAPANPSPSFKGKKNE